MNEAIHIGISAFGSIVSALVGYIVHDLRDRLTKMEDEVSKASADIAQLRGYLQGKANGLK